MHITHNNRAHAGSSYVIDFYASFFEYLENIICAKPFAPHLKPSQSLDVLVPVQINFEKVKEKIKGRIKRKVRILN
jgi:hypothetical protein